MNKQKIMIAALLVTLVGGGIAGAALLPQANADTQTSAVTNNEAGKTGAGNVEKSDGDGEVADDQEASDGDGEVADDQEVANVQQVLKDAAVTKEQAIAIAQKEFAGTAKEVKIEDEDGKTVYNVIITDASGKEHEVNVDLLTGKIAAEND
ncbi:PepSY domain-containing protein [Paenibacillus aurantiacus]|uniref:PepSY domain-containing protein n=1 Tax=Paenibacillus aurantiacus TaxID=1936118 RepID=A0ABV5KTT5_9BACL